MKNNNQSGRSMIEMLGVLAIIGVLSIGGIAGYSKAMAKYRLSKVNEQVSMIIANTKTTFGTKNDFIGLDKSMACKLNLFPSEMISGNCVITNTFNGNVDLKVIERDDTVFALAFAGLSHDACVSIFTSNWGGDSSSGFLGMVYSPDLWGQAWIGSYPPNPDVEDEFIPSELPLNPVEAQTLCSQANRINDIAITWYFR